MYVQYYSLLSPVMSEENDEVSMAPIGVDHEIHAAGNDLRRCIMLPKYLTVPQKKVEIKQRWLMMFSKRKMS